MFHYHFRIGKATRRHFAHHELTQDEIDCRLVYRIAIAQRLQSCLHLINCTSPFRISSFSGSVTSRIFLIDVIKEIQGKLSDILSFFI